MRVLICGGGTGGHIFPALSVVNSLRRMGVSGENILWIGTSGQIEERLVPRANLRLETIAAGPIAGVSLLEKIKNTAKMTWSIGVANRIMARFMPDVLFMTGGYVNGPVAAAAWLRRIPALIYLLDIEPGMAIRRLSRLAEIVAATTEASKGYFPAGKVVVTGYPIREQLREAVTIGREEALRQFDLFPGRKTLLVTGGSRGARSINRALMGILPELLDTVQVVHLSGTLDWPEVQANAERLSEEQRPYYRPYPFLHRRMGAAFRSADLVLARAGASMLGECPAFGLPAILVPYPYAWRYQRVNAEYLVERGAAIMLADERLSDQLLPTMSDVAHDSDRLELLAAASR
ncbi:MAG: UDP-N-acetylglucosamine--N-acetylmuramyl-(pentapeptide) pyrophosphoryl-undecaprenol N-acetylglucosamine transferase, partial [Chloroflexota bacterium]